MVLQLIKVENMWNILRIKLLRNSQNILKRKQKVITVKPVHIKENIFVFIRCLINDPSFNGQVKEFLTTPMSKFGSKCELDNKFIDKIAKMGLMETAMNLSAFKENKDLKKSDGRKELL